MTETEFVWSGPGVYPMRDGGEAYAIATWARGTTPYVADGAQSFLILGLMPNVPAYIHRTILWGDNGRAESVVRDHPYDLVGPRIRDLPDDIDIGPRVAPASEAGTLSAQISDLRDMLAASEQVAAERKLEIERLHAELAERPKVRGPYHIHGHGIDALCGDDLREVKDEAYRIAIAKPGSTVTVLATIAACRASLPIAEWFEAAE